MKLQNLTPQKIKTMHTQKHTLEKIIEIYTCAQNHTLQTSHHPPPSLASHAPLLKEGYGVASRPGRLILIGVVSRLGLELSLWNLIYQHANMWV